MLSDSGTLLGTPSFAACANQMNGGRPSRFVLKDGEAFDPKTGLTWKRCSVGRTWKKGDGCSGEPDAKQELKQVQLAVPPDARQIFRCNLI